MARAMVALEVQGNNMGIVKNYILRHPLRALFLGYNLGIFTWLQTHTGVAMANTNVEVPWFLQWMDFEQLKSFMMATPFSWLIISIVLGLLLRVVGKVVKLIIIIALIAVSIYLLSLYSTTGTLF